MARVLQRVVASQAGMLRGGEQFLHAARARPLPGSASAGQLPPQMIWAVTEQRLLVWNVEGRSASQPGALITGLELGTVVTGAMIGEFVGREVGVIALAEGHPASVLMEPPDAELIVSIINAGAVARKPVVPPPPPRSDFTVTPVDISSGDERVGQLNEALAAGDWKQAEQLYGDVDDPAVRELLVMRLDGAAARPGLDAWVEARPDSSAAWLFDGAGRALAWRNASFGPDGEVNVTDDGVAAMREADAALLYAIELSFDDPVVWTPLLLTGAALAVPIEELCIRYDESVRRHQGLYIAHRLILEGLGDEQQGSQTQMFAFARAIARAAPEGSPLHALVPMAHLIAHRSVGEEDPRHRYFSADVRREVEFFAAMSVDNAAFEDVPTTVEALNIFAAAFARGGDSERAKQLADRIGDRRTPDPWRRFPDGDRLFAEARSGS